LAARHFGDGYQIEDFPHLRRLQCDNLALQVHRQHLERRVDIRRFHRCSLSLQPTAFSRSSLAWLLSTRCGTSRISATVPSPRRVAPEKAPTSACSFDNYLMTV